jgi:hypothetical protein
VSGETKIKKEKRVERKRGKREQIRRLGRSGKRNDLYNGHTDILPKVENGKQLSKKCTFQ